MTWMNKLNKPWLHFIALGIVFYQLQGVLFSEPKTVIGPLSEARVAALQQQWHTTTGQQATPQQTAKLIDLELNRDVVLQRALELNIHRHDNIVYQRLIRNMHFLQLADNKSDDELFEQALAMRLHLNDNVVKRRLIQVMEQQLLAEKAVPLPSKQDVKAAFQNRVSELRRPPLYSFEHLFFNRERELEAPAIIAKITEQQLDFQAAKHLSSPYLQGHKFIRQSPRQLTQNFGKAFVSSLEQVKPAPQQWLGPIRSVFGLHYVWLNALEPERDAQLIEVEQQLRNDLSYTAQTKALQNAIANLRQDYDVRGMEINTLDSRGVGQ